MMFVARLLTISRDNGAADLASSSQGRGTTTKDSLEGYITSTVMPTCPNPDAPLDAKKDYLDRQLDCLIGYAVLDVLTVVGGHKNRLHGGV
jgi:hypothetical protein